MPESDTLTTVKPPFDVDQIRADFPVLSQKVHGKPLVYLDNAATTQKPQRVIERVRQFDSEEYGTVRRGAYKLSERATQMFEDVRQKVAGLFNAADKKEIIFTSGTTQAINLVAYSFGKAFVKEGDEIIISNIEHHANTVPWQVLCQDKGAHLKVIVNKGAQLTNSDQLINNLMLSDEAHADNKPNLMIFADDVKCTHGTTVGQINEDQLFYLKTRGLSQELAKSLLTTSFVNSLIQTIPFPDVVADLNEVLLKKLEAKHA